MFYDDNDIQHLIDRIGWADSIQPSPLTIESRNLLSNSGRYVREFHKMAIVENVKETMPNAQADLPEFNDFLYSMKKEAVLSSLSLIFDNNERANYKMTNCGRIDISGINYSGIITTKDRLFDDVIGYTIAAKTLELFQSSNRKNDDARGTKYNYSMLVGELSGIKNEIGKEISIGLYGLQKRAVWKISNILFPQNTTPSLTARRVW